MVWEVLASSALQAGVGIYGANAAANAQEDAAKRAGDASSRGTLAQLQLQEPQRFLGYQALGDLGALYGYQQAPYTTIGQVQNTLTPLGTKEIKQAIKAGYTPEQIMSLGSLNNVKGKQIKQLTRLGFTPNQLMQMQQGGMAASSAPTTAATGAPASGTSSQPAAGNMSRFFTSPDYQFRMNEGLSAIDRSAAARGGALSGNAIRGGTEYASNLASGEYSNYVNRLLTMAGLGSAATNNAGGAIGNNAANQANSQMAAGDARASGIMGGVNTAVNAINNGMNLWMLQRQMTQPANAPPTGYTPAPGMGIMPWRP